MRTLLWLLGVVIILGVLVGILSGGEEQRLADVAVTPLEHSPHKSLCTEERESSIEESGLIRKSGGRSVFVDLFLWSQLERDEHIDIGNWAATCLFAANWVRIKNARTGNDLAKWSRSEGYRVYR